jgi:hypothetical protein
MEVTFTKFTNTEGIFTKTADLKQGSLVREPQAKFYKGKFESVTVNWGDDFIQYISNLEHSEALCLGTHKNKKQGIVVNGIRLESNFTYRDEPGTYNLCYLDIDEINKLDSVSTISDVMDYVFQQLPELKKVSSGFVVYPSSGSYLFREEDNYQFSDLTGLHIYFLLRSDYHAKRDLKPYVEASSLVNGVSRYTVKLSKSGEGITRGFKHVTDLTTFDSNKPIFTSGSSCGAGVRQDRGKPLFIKPFKNSYDDFEFDNFTTDEIKLLKDNLKNSPENKEKLRVIQTELSSKGKGAGALKEIEGDHNGDPVYEFDINTEIPLEINASGSVVKSVSAFEVLFNPEEYNDSFCLDVEEPDYARGLSCKLYVSDSRVYVKSYAHGGRRFQMTWTPAGVLDVLNNLGWEGMDNISGGKNNWLSLLSEAGIDEDDRAEVIEHLAGKGTGKSGKTVSALNRLIASKGKSKKNSKLNDKLNEMNAKYDFIATAGNNIICYSARNSIGQKIVKKKNIRSFIEVELPNTVFALSASGAPKPVQVAEEWLRWDKRNEFEDFAFRPSTTEQRVRPPETSKDVPAEMRNLFTGWACEPVQVQDFDRCQGRACDGVGCLKWAAGEGNWGLCKEQECNWTYWANHIYENMCNKNDKLARVFISWIANIFQSPEQIPGTTMCIWGEGGCGKSQAITPITVGILGEFGVTANGDKDLTGDFNSHFACKLLMEGDEATFGDDPKSVRRMKSLTTSKYISVNEKYVPGYSVMNYMRVFLTSNDENFVFAEADERRQQIMKVGTSRKQDFDYFARFAVNGDMRKGKERIPDELNVHAGELLGMLLKWEVTDIHEIVDTDALRESKKRSHPVHLRVLLRVLEEKYKYLNCGGARLFNDTVINLYKSEFSEPYLNASKFMVLFKKMMTDKFGVPNTNPRLSDAVNTEFGSGFEKGNQPRGWDIPSDMIKRIVRGGFELTQADFSDTR